MPDITYPAIASAFLIGVSILIGIGFAIGWLVFGC